MLFCDFLYPEDETNQYQAALRADIDALGSSQRPVQHEQKTCSSTYYQSIVAPRIISGSFGFHAGIELVVLLLFGDEFIVGTLLNNATLLKNNDTVTVSYR